MLKWRRRDAFQPDGALDLGSRRSRWIQPGSEVVSQASAVVWDLSVNRCLWSGDEAAQRMGRHPRHQSVIFPIGAGLLADFDAGEALVRSLLGATRSRPQVLLGAPALSSDAELQVLVEVVREAGASSVGLVPASLGLAWCSGLPLLETSALAVVDVGHELLQASIYSRGAAVLHRQRQGGGRDLARRLKEHFLRRHWLEVGTDQLSKLVTQLHCPRAEEPSSEGEFLTVRGRDLQSGLPRSFMASRWELDRLLDLSLRPLVGMLGELIEELPPDLLQQLLRQGIFVAGGLSRLTGLDSYLSRHLSLPVFLLEQVEDAVAVGLQGMLEDPRSLQALLSSSALVGSWT